MTSNTSNPVVLVTGGAKRIGAAIVRKLHQQNYNVVLHYRASVGPATALADELNAERANSIYLLQADLLNVDVSAMAQQAIDAWGRLDLLVNNASSFYPTPVGGFTQADWDDLVGSNLKAPLFLTQACASALTQQQGAVVNIIDVHAKRPMANHVVYTAAKAGLAGMTRAYAKDLAPQVRVNGVAPGAMLWPEQDDDPQRQQEILSNIALQRTGQPEDIADAVYWLAQAPYVTGEIIAVDGGRSLGW